MGVAGLAAQDDGFCLSFIQKKKKKPTETFQSGANRDPGDIVAMALQTPVGKPDPGISNSGLEQQ